MANPQKDTVYIDIDDEITSIIEKLQNSPQKIVALVLPKRATVLQSVVNMKLLRRSADQAQKHVVLITSESNLLPIAGAVGMYVAPTLQSRPVVPPAPAGSTPMANDESDADTASESDDFDPEALADQPIGGLAGVAGATGTGPQTAGLGAGAADLGAAASGRPAFDDTETIQLDNEDIPAAGAEAAAVASSGGSKSDKIGTTGAAGQDAKTGKAGKSPKPPKKDKKLKVPNFNKFRLLLIAGAALLLLLIGGFIYANTALAKAVITLQTNSSDVATKADLNVDPSADQYDPASNTIPAKIVDKQQVSTQQVATSGQKNNGTKASGSVKMTAGSCSADVPNDVAAGTGISANGQTFITQTATSFVPTISGGKCTYSSDGATDVTAQAAGAAYNIAATSFTVASRSDVSAKSSDAFAGGTDNIIKVVAQTDIDSAKQKITSQTKDSSSLKDELTNKLAGLGYTSLTASLQAADPKVTSSANVGDQADTVTVTATTDYTMYGVKQSDLKSVVLENVDKQLDSSKQKVLRDGVSAAKFQIDTPTTSGPLQVSISATSLIGPNIDESKLIAQLAGKKTGDIKSLVTQTPGVSDATVSYSPFWVSSVPKNTSHVTLVIEKSSGTTTTGQ